jgi:hypothetical protein
VRFATHAADVDAFCKGMAAVGRPCRHRYNLVLLGCSVEVRAPLRMSVRTSISYGCSATNRLVCAHIADGDGGRAATHTAGCAQHPHQRRCPAIPAITAAAASWRRNQSAGQSPMEPEPHQPCQLASDSKLHVGKRWQRCERLHPRHGAHARLLCWIASGHEGRLLALCSILASWT